MKNLLKGATDLAAKSNLQDWNKVIKEQQEQLKAYILENLKEEDFMFTDQVRQVPSRGIRGPKEVKERIKSYLSDMQIYTEGELVNLF